MLTEKKRKKEKKKTSLLASNWPSQFCWSFWLQPPGGREEASPSPYPHSGSLWPSSPAAALNPQVQELTLLRTMDAGAGPSLIHTLLGACGLISLRVALSLYFECGLMSPTPLREPWASRWRGDWSCCCRRISQSAPKGLFLFEKILLLNPVARSI